MSTTLEIIFILFTSMVKFAYSPLLALHLGYDLWETMVMIGLGGCMSVIFFFFSSGWILEKLEDRRAVAVEEGRRSVRNNFTRTNKMIVKVKRNQGLNGLAAITPIILSLPIGAIIAAKYFRHERRTLPVLLSSVLIWDVILSSIWNLTQ